MGSEWDFHNKQKSSMTYTAENPAILKRYDKIFFGKKEKGKMVGDVLRRNPQFIIWCHENLPWVRFEDDIIAEAKGEYQTVSPKEIYDEVTKDKPWCASMVDKRLKAKQEELPEFVKMQEQYNNFWESSSECYDRMQEQYRNYTERKLSLFQRIKNRLCHA